MMLVMQWTSVDSCAVQVIVFSNTARDPTNIPEVLGFGIVELNGLSYFSFPQSFLDTVGMLS
jgi:hypothetical protein